MCVVGDGEAETGPLTASWHSNKFLNPATDGAVFSVLHRHGCKIANRTALARIPEEELFAQMRGCLSTLRTVPSTLPPASARPTTPLR